MEKDPSVIWLRFRCDRSPSNTQLFMSLPLDAIDSVATEKCLLMKRGGEKYSSGAINYFAKKLADVTSSADEHSSFHANGSLPSDVEHSIIELAVVLYAHVLTFSNLTKDVLSSSILECVYEVKHGTAAYHVSIPGNIFDRGLLCPSVHMDNFLDIQRKIQYSTMNLLSERMFVVDDIVSTYEKTASFTKEVESNSFIALFVVSACQDFSPACSLILGGRLDAAYAIARRNIEVLGAARIIADDPNAGTIWASAHKDEASWKMFKKLFTIKNMFPTNNLLWEKLFGLYDLLSREHHPNPNSFDRIKEVSRDSSSISFSVSATSFEFEDVNRSVGAFWVICYIFCVILVGYISITLDHYKKDQSDDLKSLGDHAAELTQKIFNEMRNVDKKSYGLNELDVT